LPQRSAVASDSTVLSGKGTELRRVQAGRALAGPSFRQQVQPPTGRDIGRVPEAGRFVRQPRRQHCGPPESTAFTRCRVRRAGARAAAAGASTRSPIIGAIVPAGGSPRPRDMVAALQPSTIELQWSALDCPAPDLPPCSLPRSLPVTTHLQAGVPRPGADVAGRPSPGADVAG
jgi:hypothetical protein